MLYPSSFVAFKVPRALKSKDNSGNSKYYSIYNLIAQLMYMNQQLNQILDLDVFDAMMMIKSYARITNPNQKEKPRQVDRVFLVLI